MNVRSLKLEDERFGTQWFDEVEDRWDYADMQAHPAWRRGWISMDCAVLGPDEGRVYLGVTCFDATRIFQAYDRKAGRFVDLGYDRVADPYDAKFHRSLVRASDGSLYAAVALLHDVDRFLKAPGGAVVRYDPASGAIEKLGVPVPHVYIQSLVLDEERRTAYGLCFAPEMLCAFDLDTRRGRSLGLVGTGYGGPAMPENIVRDGEGCVWSSWSLTRAWQSAPGVDALRLCKYDPRADRVRFFDQGLPRPEGGHGFVKPEAFFEFGDGYVYASGGNGALYRVDPATGRAEHLCTPTPDRRSRLSSLARAEDGTAYGITGRDGECELMRVDYRTGRFEKLGRVRDRDGEPLWQCHDIVRAQDGTLYVCENDNPYRSGYLWEIVP